MKVFFDSEELKDLFECAPDHLLGKQKFPTSVIKQYQANVNILKVVKEINVLRSFRSLNFESLKGDLKGKYSIRLNKQYRLIFKINRNGEVEILIIEISKHYE